MGDLGAPLVILWSYLSDFPFFFPFTSSLVRPKRILRKLALVFVERSLGFRVPKLLLAIGELLPGETNDCGERAVVGLDLGRHMVAFDERGTEQNKSVGWARNMILRLLLTVACTTRRGAVIGRRENYILARRGIDKRWRSLIEGHRGDGWYEGDTLYPCGRRLDWKSPYERIDCEPKIQLPSLLMQYSMI